MCKMEMCEGPVSLWSGKCIHVCSRLNLDGEKGMCKKIASLLGTVKLGKYTRSSCGGISCYMDL